jgi:hypothetical protein
VTVPSQGHAPLDVLLTAVTFLVIIILLMFWRIDYPAEFKRWRAFAGQAGQTAKRWVQQT